eukprot:gene21329-biopygen31809
MATWSQPDDGGTCGQEQHGCPAQACDFFVAKPGPPWCETETTGCIGEEQSADCTPGAECVWIGKWFYCNTQAPTVAPFNAGSPSSNSPRLSTHPLEAGLAQESGGTGVHQVQQPGHAEVQG